jgi:small redox-active disulfide protein 2
MTHCKTLKNMNKKEDYIMGLFSKNKKTEGSCCCGDVSGLIVTEGQGSDTEGSSCSCGGNCDENINQNKDGIAGGQGLVIKILGSGCKNCITLAENTKAALEEMKLEAEIVKVTDFGEITRYGVMSTPALVVNEKVVAYGKVLKPQEIIKILSK